MSQNITYLKFVTPRNSVPALNPKSETANFNYLLKLELWKTHIQPLKETIISQRIWFKIRKQIKTKKRLEVKDLFIHDVNQCQFKSDYSFAKQAFSTNFWLILTMMNSSSFHTWVEREGSIMRQGVLPNATTFGAGGT